MSPVEEMPRHAPVARTVICVYCKQIVQPALASHGSLVCEPCRSAPPVRYRW
jgi:hypothetical protein